jgi:hypothetical protein
MLYSDAADGLLPLDGPYDPAAIVQAARAVQELVRHVNHATLRPTVFTYPSEIYDIICALRNAAWGQGQLFNQLAAALDRWATNPHLRSDDGIQPGPVALRAAATLRTVDLTGITDPLQIAAQLVARLGLTD